MINIKPLRLYFIFLSLLICLLDQFSKYIISINYKSVINKDLILFTIDYLENHGAAFNIFNGSRILLSTISLLFSLVLIYFIFKNNINKPRLYTKNMFKTLQGHQGIDTNIF